MIPAERVRRLEAATAALEAMSPHYPMHPRPYVQELVAAAREVLDSLPEEP